MELLATCCFPNTTPWVFQSKGRSGFCPTIQKHGRIFLLLGCLDKFHPFVRLLALYLCNLCIPINLQTQRTTNCLRPQGLPASLLLSCLRHDHEVCFGDVNPRLEILCLRKRTLSWEKIYLKIFQHLTTYRKMLDALAVWIPVDSNTSSEYHQLVFQFVHAFAFAFFLSHIGYFE